MDFVVHIFVVQSYNMLVRFPAEFNRIYFFDKLSTLY